MNKFALSLLGIAIACASTCMDAQARGVAGTWATPVAAPAVGPMAAHSGTAATTGSSAAAAASVMAPTGPKTAGVHGFAVPGSSGLVNPGGGDMTGGLQRNPDGTVSRTNLVAGSLSSQRGSSYIGQSRINNNFRGIGNSQINRNNQGVGNSQASQSAAITASASVAGAHSNGAPATASSIMNHFSSATSKAQGSTATAAPATPLNRACASKSGSTTTCN